MRMARRDSSGKVPNPPMRSSTSEPRARRKLARDVVAGPAARSTTRTERPCNNSPQARVSPVGPGGDLVEMRSEDLRTGSTNSTAAACRPCPAGLICFAVGQVAAATGRAANLVLGIGELTGFGRDQREITQRIDAAGADRRSCRPVARPPGRWLGPRRCCPRSTAQTHKRSKRPTGPAVRPSKSRVIAWRAASSAASRSPVLNAWTSRKATS